MLRKKRKNWPRETQTKADAEKPVQIRKNFGLSQRELVALIPEHSLP